MLIVPLCAVTYEFTVCMCFVFLQADNLPDIPQQTVTEEKYTDEHGNMVVKKVRNIQRCQQHQNIQKLHLKS